MRAGILQGLAVLLLLGTNVEAVGSRRYLSEVPEAREALRRTVGAKLYRSLLISPVEGWIIVRGQLGNDRLIGPIITHSELGGLYDSLALDLARNLRILDYTQSETPGAARTVLVNLVIYQIADTKMAISFGHFAEPGGSQLRYSGAAWIAVLKENKWVSIEPLGLSPNERSGPRSYSMAVETPGSLPAFGNGRLPRVGLSIQGGQAAPTHVSRSR